MQSRKEGEPVFQLIGERGQNRYREFEVQVTCMHMVQTGIGPNKKVGCLTCLIQAIWTLKNPSFLVG
jgi:dsRNA-specific ribonuclease